MHTQKNKPKAIHIELRAKNNLLLGAMKKCNIATVAELARLTHLSQNILQEYLTLKTSPLEKNGEWKSSALSLGIFFQCTPESLFCHEEQLMHIEHTRLSAEVTFIELNQLLCGDGLKDADISKDILPETIISANELKGAIWQVLLQLTPQERSVIRMRFGLDGAVMSRKDVGIACDMKERRVRAIELRAMQRLCSPIFRDILKVAGALDEDTRDALGRVE